MLYQNGLESNKENTKKILIIDDSGFKRLSIKNALSRGGYNLFLECDKGTWGVEIYHEEHPDIVLISAEIYDISGLEVLKEIIKNDPNAIVVFMLSPSNKQSLAFEALKAGAKDIIIEPLKSDCLLKTVKNLIG